MKPQRPPLRLWLGYRLLDRRLPDEYRPWLLADLNSRFHTMINSLVFLVAAQLGAYVLWNAYASITEGELKYDALYGDYFLQVIGAMAAFAIIQGLIPTTEAARERRLYQHGFAPDGTTIPS